MTKAARELQKRRQVKGFEYEATLRQAEERYAEALELINKGLAIEPNSISLLLDLAWCNMGFDRHRDCEAALKRAEEAGATSVDTVRILAILRLIQDRAAEGLTILRALDVKESDFNGRLKVQNQIAWILSALDQHEAVLDTLEPLEVPPDAEPHERSQKFLMEAKAWFHGRHDSETAMGIARKAYAADPTNRAVLDTVRNIRGLDSKCAKVYGVNVVATGAQAFQGLYFVIAEDPQQAFLFIQELEVPEIAPGLKLMDAEVRPIQDDPPLGVVHIISRNFGFQ